MGMTAVKFEADQAKFAAPPDKFAELVVQLKKINHGKVTIFMIDGKPDRIEEVIKGTKI